MQWNTVPPLIIQHFVHYEKGLTYTITLEDPQGNTVYTNTRYCQESWHREYITVENPQLWYPVGYGEQPLYTLRLCGKEQRFGIRTVRIEQLPDEKGSDYYNLCRKLKKTPSGKPGMVIYHTYRTVIVNPYKDIVVDELNAEKKEEA